jgi:hypothetical protein
MNKKRTLIAALLGVAYIFVYGFFAMFETGGGHGNFIWLMLLIFVNCFGLYFPIMAMLAVNLRSHSIRIFYGCLLAANVIVSTVLIVGWMTETSIDGRPTDFERTYQVVGASGLIFSAVIHFLPSIFFMVLLIRSLFASDKLSTDGDVRSLQLS